MANALELIERGAVKKHSNTIKCEWLKFSGISANKSLLLLPGIYIYIYIYINLTPSEVILTSIENILASIHHDQISLLSRLVSGQFQILFAIIRFYFHYS